MAPARSIVLLAPVYVRKCILAYKSVECYQIGALSAFKCLIYEIVYNLRHDHLHSFKCGAKRPFALDDGISDKTGHHPQITVEACYLQAVI